MVLNQEGPAGDQQDAAAGSKPKAKVKSVDLPIVASNIRQLDSDMLSGFVEYEVRTAESWFDPHPH